MKFVFELVANTNSFWFDVGIISCVNYGASNRHTVNRSNRRNWIFLLGTTLSPVVVKSLKSDRSPLTMCKRVTKSRLIHFYDEAEKAAAWLRFFPPGRGKLRRRSGSMRRTIPTVRPRFSIVGSAALIADALMERTNRAILQETIRPLNSKATIETFPRVSVELRWLHHRAFGTQASWIRENHFPFSVTFQKSPFHPFVFVFNSIKNDSAIKLDNHQISIFTIFRLIYSSITINHWIIIALRS